MLHHHRIGFRFVPDGHPQPGELHRASPETSTTNDVHGVKPRPCAVVERARRVALTLTRTTHPEKDARTVASSRNDELGLDLDGYWQDRFQRPIAKKFWGTPDFSYVGQLPSDEWSDLQAFWKVTEMLGRKNL